VTFVHQIENRLAPAEIVAGVLLYIIIRSVVWCLRQALRETDKAFKSDRQRIIHRHVHDGHKGHYKKCRQPDCAELAAAIIDTI